MTSKQRAAAGMLGRGESQRFVARTLHLSPRTVRAWVREDDDFIAEVERVAALGGTPDARGTLLDALAARRDDGVDWPSRVRAALALIEMDGAPTEDDAAYAATDW